MLPPGRSCMHKTECSLDRVYREAYRGRGGSLTIMIQAWATWFAWIAGFLMLGGTAQAADVSRPSGDVTFHRDVLPILQKNCQNCHRAGQIGPMSLLTYEEARPWAKAIKAAVLNHKMPP